MKFLVDNHLPPALVRWLTAKGADATHVLDLGLDTENDAPIWARAVTESRIVISKDEDFFHLANRAGDSGKLLWVRLGNCRTMRLLERFETDWPRIVQAFQDGHRVVMLT
jgi:predicted nuclease of predicted toxin-antitoxin system